MRVPVWVDGDEDVGIFGYPGWMISESDGFAVVVDEDGNVDEVRRRFVHTRREHR